MNVREHRIQSEWEFLLKLAEWNAAVISSTERKLIPEGVEFRLILARTAALAGSASVAR